jgi:hypothetical protein
LFLVVGTAAVTTALGPVVHNIHCTKNATDYMAALLFKVKKLLVKYWEK